MAELEPLLDCHDLAKLMKKSSRTIQSQSSQHPELLPPRAPGRLLRWHPAAYYEWAMGRVPAKRGRPRKDAPSRG
jgi:hypothetical protein